MGGGVWCRRLGPLPDAGASLRHGEEQGGFAEIFGVDVRRAIGPAMEYQLDGTDGLGGRTQRLGIDRTALYIMSTRYALSTQFWGKSDPITT